jgi:hypothetical protein
MADDFQVLAKTLRLEMARDKRYARLKTAFDTLPMFNLPADDLLDEVKNLNTMRMVRRLNSTSPDFVDRIIKAALHDQATRSRLTEILTDCLRAKRTLETALDSFTEYALVRYTSTLSSCRTKADKEALVRLFMSDWYDYLNSMMTLYSTTQLVVEDLDKSAWTIKNIIDACKLIYAPEHKFSS